MTPVEYVGEQITDNLDRLAQREPDAVAWTCYSWLIQREAGLPVLGFMDGEIRKDARFWAETATPPELEIYAFAALDRILTASGGNAPFASRQIKRMMGALWKRMSDQERQAFLGWIAKDDAKDKQE